MIRITPVVRSGFLLCLAAMLAVGAVSAQTTIYVDDDNCPGPGSGTVGDPFCLIQDAICSIKDTGGGTVMVSPGLYNESLRMFPGVSVISTDGPAVTTIDATGKACTKIDCTPSTSNLTCSVVVYGSGSVSADRLEGFRITGGAGLFRDFGSGEPSNAVAGGGVFVFNSSPTITGNEIVDNQLFSSGTKNYWGAGMYVAGSFYPFPNYPMITDNLIQGNIANPPSGTGSNPSDATGGGIYVSFYGSGLIENNTIRSNTAGDSGVTKQIGLGGGIAVYTITPYDEPVFSRNLIQDNSSHSFGGGLFFGASYVEATSMYVASKGKVENSLIELNRSFAGGGVHVGATTALLRGNTIVDNMSDFGGGISFGTAVDPDQATVVNNIVAFNSALFYSGGGFGISYADPLVHHNDLFGNVPLDVDGTKSNADYIGVDDNVSVDPDFVNRMPGSRDLRLMEFSPAIDAGDNTGVSGLDLDGIPRIQDGNGDMIAVVDLGAYEFPRDSDNDGTEDWLDPDDDDDGVLDDGDSSGNPADNFCTGGQTTLCDDNCRLVPNPNQENQDGDALGDACDPDDDNDGVADGPDCDSLVIGVSQVPPQLGNSLRIIDPGGLTTLSWHRAREGHVSNVYRGTIAPGQPWTYNEVCFRTELTDPTTNDFDIPASGSAFYYLVSGKNSCGEGPEGRDGSQNDLYPSPFCGSLGLDADSDGLADLLDNCPETANAAQTDGDVDFAGDACDNCPGLQNFDQAQSDSDSLGDACDNCPKSANENQADIDLDGLGDVCDDCQDIDADQQCDLVDNCPMVANPSQSDVDGDGAGDDCDSCTDTDGDGFGNPGFSANTCSEDNCPMLSNMGQADADTDGIGDDCDSCINDPDNDSDLDGICGDLDNCPGTANAGQADEDSDFVGDVCDNCLGLVNTAQTDDDADGLGNDCDSCPNDAQNDADSDGVCGNVDNCPDTSNNTQTNSDGDMFGDACDNCISTSNPTQADTDLDTIGDACDTCTDTDGDTFGNPGFPANTCPTDNCPTLANMSQANADGDSKGDACDACPNDALDDIDGDTVCGDIDNCPTFPNFNQANNDGDMLGDACDPDDDNDTIDDGPDNCPFDANTSQADGDGDGTGDPCDNCPTDSNSNQADVDADGAGNACDACPADPANDSDVDGICGDVDNCPVHSNPLQEDGDGDAIGDVCDPCPTDPDLDLDGVCNDETALIEAFNVSEEVLVEFGATTDTVVVQAGTAMDFLANYSDPGLGLTWKDPGFDDSSWTAGFYGVGYEAVTGAEYLLQTTVADGAASIYTRTPFFIADIGTVTNVYFGADYDDGVVAWINGIEVYRSAGMPSGAPMWDADPASHEASNGFEPNYEPQADVTTAALSAMQTGQNLLAVAVYNNMASLPFSSDLVLVPRLSYNRAPTMKYLANATDPLLGLGWVAEAFDDSSWTDGWYGVGYETSSGAQDLIQSPVASGAFSVYTRAHFNIANILGVNDVHLGVDYDDAYIAWINGVEVYRSPEMPSSPPDPDWDTDATGLHESSNDPHPKYVPFQDISSAAIPAMHSGDNVLAIGVWNRSAPGSSDLVLVPRLSINRIAPKTMTYLANSSDPGIGTSWTLAGFDDSTWTDGAYGVGYDTSATGAQHLIQTTVPPGTYSIYTRAPFQISNVGAINRLLLGVDFDDGYVAWINGVEVFRSQQVPAGGPAWDTNVDLHESSNGTAPNYAPRNDISAIGIPVLTTGQNLLAIGVWNNDAPASDDLVLVPQLTIDGLTVDNCPTISNPGQENTDGDSQGDACDLDDDNDGVIDVLDNCDLVKNVGQEDFDGDFSGDACDNCPATPNFSQDDLDLDGVGDSCDNCPDDSNADQLDFDSDGEGDACDADDDNDGVDDTLDNCHFAANTGQADADGDSHGNACDCDSSNDVVWARPAEILSVSMDHDAGLTTMTWMVPLDPGGTGPLVYDVLRSADPSNFDTLGLCLETDESDLLAEDSATPASGTLYAFLVRAENACPGGPGLLGYGSDMIERVGRTCP